MFILAFDLLIFYNNSFPSEVRASPQALGRCADVCVSQMTLSGAYRVFAACVGFLLGVFFFLGW